MSSEKQIPYAQEKSLQASNELSPETIFSNLNTITLPKSILYQSQVSSTMDVARDQLQLATPEDVPLLVLTDEQIAGRGRLKRSWVAPPGSAILFSLALQPGSWLTPMQAPALVWMAGVALCEGIQEVTALLPRLKWPNDVMLALPTHSPPSDQLPRFGKVSGILLESGTRNRVIEWAVLGCGINVNAGPPPDVTIRYPATSLASIAGKPISRLDLLCSILTRLDYWYSILQQGQQSQLFAAWRGMLCTLGQQVQVQTARGMVLGYAEDVESSGALRVRDSNSQVHIVSSGDVSMSWP